MTFRWTPWDFLAIIIVELYLLKSFQCNINQNFVRVFVVKWKRKKEKWVQEPILHPQKALNWDCVTSSNIACPNSKWIHNKFGESCRACYVYCTAIFYHVPPRNVFIAEKSVKWKFISFTTMTWWGFKIYQHIKYISVSNFTKYISIYNIFIYQIEDRICWVLTNIIFCFSVRHNKAVKRYFFLNSAYKDVNLYINYILIYTSLIVVKVTNRFENNNDYKQWKLEYNIL